MNQELFEAMLHALDVETMARLIVDLEEAQAGWPEEPDQAPTPAVRMGLRQVLDNLINLGMTVAESEGIAFQELIEEVRASRAEEWASERARQEQQNWYKDFG